MVSTRTSTRVSTIRDIYLVSKAEKLLQTYDFSDLLDINDLTEEDVVQYLLDQDMIDYIKPVDL